MGKVVMFFFFFFFFFGGGGIYSLVYHKTLIVMCHLWYYILLSNMINHKYQLPAKIGIHHIENAQNTLLSFTFYSLNVCFDFIFQLLAEID